MPYFTMEKIFLFPSFDIPLKEREKINTFLQILELSGVGEIIKKATKKEYAAGRHSYNPYRLFATIAYAFSKHSGSVRSIEESLNFDLRFIYLMEQERPTYPTISSFLNNVVVPYQHEIFSRIIMTVITYFDINIDDVFFRWNKILKQRK